MKAAADGYTIFAIHDFIHSTYYTGVAEMTYKDFEPVSLMTATPSILGAYGKAPWNSLKELIDDAKKRPEQITVGATLGSTAHFFPAMVALAAGVKWKYVSYEGTAPRMTALLGGHVLLGDTNLTQMDKVKGGQIKMLAIATPQRLAEVPDVPTFQGAGIRCHLFGEPGNRNPEGSTGGGIGQAGGSLRQGGKRPGGHEIDERAGNPG